ncbi:MAG TPA: DICT sensory domain-containing protein [Solirubrobacteraceae bacterium]|jgi:DICT domain-containing protein
MNDLAIKDVAERTGIAPGTIRMWEQRYGFPEPDRTESGYRRYTDDDVEALRRVSSYRRLGLSIPAAIERVRTADVASDRPSIYAAVSSLDPSARPQLLRRSTLVALSSAIEHEALARAASPVLFAAFQEERFYRAVEHRYRRLAAQSDAACVFAAFDEARRPRGGPAELPIDLDDAIGNEWAVIVDAPGYSACLLAWEHPRDVDLDRHRRFEAIWTVHPQATRRAAQVAAKLAGQIDPSYGAELDALLDGRPLAVESPAPGLTALANRAIAYMEASAPD